MRAHGLRTVLVMSLVGAVALLASAHFAAAHVTSVQTNVSIHYGDINNKAFEREFRGQVKSPEHACEKTRVVKVFHRVKGPDTLVGSTESNSNGSWSIPNDIAKGRHYAKVKSRAVGSRFCKPAKSETIKVSQA
jgi:hypothetical protein